MPIVPLPRHEFPPAAWDWTTRALRDSGFDRPTVIRRFEGIQGTVLLVGAGPGQEARFAVKAFNRRHASPDALEHEVAALRSFHKALEGRDDLSCPAPIASSSELCCYLMTHEAGRPIDQMLGERAVVQNRAARRILSGLGLFYRSVGDIYGDFQPNNLLVGPGERLVFLDPGIPNLHNPTYARLAAELEYSPASADLGYWLHTVVSRSPRLSFGRPVVAVRRWRFTEGLLALAATLMPPRGEAHPFLHEVLVAAQQHLAWLRKNAGSRGPLLSTFGLIGARRVVARATRRLAS